ncbi:zinc finger C-x8-C-x5-C-x3-H type family protein isoform X2 [Wolffia australiana]
MIWLIHWYLEGVWFLLPILRRREFRGGDLRDRLVRRYSPRRRYSPGRDGRGRQMFHGNRSGQHDRGNSASRSPEPRRGLRKRQHLDGHSDVSPSMRSPDYADDPMKSERVSSYGEVDAIEDQLKQTQLDIDMFDDHKCQLEAFIEEKVQEADKLSARIEELESQLDKEQEDCRRFTSKIKKFIKAQMRCTRAQDELKRSQARLQRVCSQVEFDASKQLNNEEDSSIHAVSDGEPSGNGRVSPRMETLNHSSPMKKKLRFENGAGEEIKIGGPRKRERSLNSTKSDRVVRSELSISQVGSRSKEDEGANAKFYKNDVHKLNQADDYHYKDSGGSPAKAPSTKGRGFDSGRGVPITSMAAQAVDEFIEAMDMEERSEEEPNKPALPFMPPRPPKPNHAHFSKYEGNDEEVNVEDVDVDVGGDGGNSEVEIEQI